MSWVYWAPKSRMRIRWCDLLDSVIWRLLDDLHIVDVRFAHAGGGDLDELRLGAHLIDRRAAGVAHARAPAGLAKAPAHPPDQLLHHPHRAALVRDAALDAFRHQLVDVHVGVLEV